MPGSTANRLSRSDLDEAFERAFVQRELTLSQIAATVPLAALCETLIAQATELAGLLAEVPDRAFEIQVDDDEGNDVWSAGQVISHLAQMQINAIPFWESIIGRRLEAPDEQILRAADTRLLGRDEAVEAARALRDSNDKLVAAFLSAEARQPTAVHFVLGVIDGAGALLATCIHGLDHLQQIEELGAACAVEERGS